MFNFFKKKASGPPPPPSLVDLENQALKVGDKVLSLRYELGHCHLIQEGEDFFYESLETGKKVHWTKMIDARSERQKVRKV